MNAAEENNAGPQHRFPLFLFMKRYKELVSGTTERINVAKDVCVLTRSMRHDHAGKQVNGQVDST